ncbi:MAG: glucuronate isomerase [Gemmatimonadaceae bacterium]
MLNPDRFFDADPAIRRVASELYEETRLLPLICPHGHVEPRMLAENARFANPATLLITPDHYIVRMLYSQGVSMESLGITRLDGSDVEHDPRIIWQLFAERFHLFLGTPSGVWLQHVLTDLFGVTEKLNAHSADRVYDAIEERLASAEYLPRALFGRFNIEVLATTDPATDDLRHHEHILGSGWNGRVVPTFRPDTLFHITSPQWRRELTRLEVMTGAPIEDVEVFVRALARRRADFKAMGATATDHGVMHPYAAPLSVGVANEVFSRAKSGNASIEDQVGFEAHMLMEMARLSTEDGLVMQLHPGVYRNHNAFLADRFGANIGGDIPIVAEFTHNLAPLLNAFGNHPNFRIVLFTLDESTYARELAPLAGHYPAVRLGPAWWFNDSIEGMTRFRQQTTETAGIWNTAGFNDDTRAFCSIPARHDLSRRIDANFLGSLVSRHIIDMDDARLMARAMAYELARDTYNFSKSE